MFIGNDDNVILHLRSLYMFCSRGQSSFFQTIRRIKGEKKLNTSIKIDCFLDTK